MRRRGQEKFGCDDYRELLKVARLTVAERSGELIGTIALLEPDADQVSSARNGELEISHLAVARSARSQGVGRLLLACAHGEASRRSARTLVASTRPAQVAVQSLLRSQGYHAVSDKNGDVDGPITYRLRVQQIDAS